MATRKNVGKVAKPKSVAKPAAPQNQNPEVPEGLPEGVLNAANGIPNPNLDRRNA